MYNHTSNVVPPNIIYKFEKVAELIIYESGERQYCSVKCIVHIVLKKNYVKSTVTLRCLHMWLDLLHWMDDAGRAGVTMISMAWQPPLDLLGPVLKQIVRPPAHFHVISQSTITSQCPLYALVNSIHASGSINRSRSSRTVTPWILETKAKRRREIDCKRDVHPHDRGAKSHVPHVSCEISFVLSLRCLPLQVKTFDYLLAALRYLIVCIETDVVNFVTPFLFCFVKGLRPYIIWN
jgi:hypothetical protein